MFPKAENADTLPSIRKPESKDIVKRMGALSPSRLHIKNHPIDTPVSVFNATAYLDGETLKLYVRIIIGYYMYVSAVALVELPISDILSGAFGSAHYSADIVVYPSTRYDVWGVEDPRVNRVGDKLTMVYTGRTVNYFNPVIRRERTLPVLAISNANDGRRWKKTGVFVFPSHIRTHIISDKDAFVVATNDGKLWLFHRPHLDDEAHHLVISRIDRIPEGDAIEEVVVRDTHIVLDPAPFEIKLGWAAPPIEVEPGKWIAFIHAVDKEMEVYRVFAALLRYNGSFYVESVTPHYIFEPREIYEVYGDRPLVVFPCGNVKIDNDILIIYGAGDYVVGIGRVEISELMSMLEQAKQT